MGNASNFRVSEKVQEAGLILGALGVIGFIGVIWLLIYGNLSGNLGFTQETDSFINQTITLNSIGATPAGASGTVNGLITNVNMTVESNGTIILSSNYTITDITITVIGTQYNGTSVNVTYDNTRDSAGLVNTENVITNLTAGFNTFFTFSNTFFTIAAIVLLIFMFLGLLAIVVLIMKLQQGKGKGFAE